MRSHAESLYRVGYRNPQKSNSNIARTKRMVLGLDFLGCIDRLVEIRRGSIIAISDKCRRVFGLKSKHEMIKFPAEISKTLALIVGISEKIKAPVFSN